MKNGIVIISQEYEANQPSVFMFCEGTYYGDLSYIRVRGNKDPSYWETAHSSDSDRYFTTYDVTFSDDIFDQIVSLQKAGKESEAADMINGLIYSESIVLTNQGKELFRGTYLECRVWIRENTYYNIMTGNFSIIEGDKRHSCGIKELSTGKSNWVF